MIKEIFLPEFFNNKRIYSQTILGFYIEDKHITCVKIFASRTKTIVQNLLKEKIEKSKTNTIKNLLSKIGKFDQVYVSIRSTSIVFNEITLPFIDEEKIRMVLDYEIEGMLPFSINEAILDFIITKKDINEKKSQVLVAAIRDKDLEEILNIYQDAGIEPNKITLDLFSIYSLYQQIPEYKNIKQTSAIINLSEENIQILFLQNGQLRLTRILPQGINEIAQKISKQSNLSFKIVKEKLINFDFKKTTKEISIEEKTDEEKLNKIIQKNILDLFNTIQFTLNSFIIQLNLQQNINLILFTGPYSKLKNLVPFCKNLLQIPCEIFNCEKIFLDNNFVNKVKNINNWSDFTITLGTVIVSKELRNFNLRRKLFKFPQNTLIKKQILTAFIIIFLIFTTIITSGYIQITKLSNKIQSIEETEKNKLRKIFPKNIKLPQKINFKNLVSKAEREVGEKLEMWSPFEKDQIKPLIILQELTNIIDKRRFDVTIESLLITEEDEKAKVEIEGFFRSKTKSNHFKYFAELEKRFARSKLLEPWDKEEIESRLEEDKGIRFSVKLKLKDQE